MACYLKAGFGSDHVGDVYCSICDMCLCFGVRFDFLPSIPPSRPRAGGQLGPSGER